MKNSHPIWLEHLLERFLDPYLYRGIIGDLVEEYHQNLTKNGKRKADLKFFTSAIGYIRYHYLLSFQSKNTNSSFMILYNYFKASIRNLRRNKENTTISLVGLIVSFTASMAIFQYTSFETSYDQFSPDHERIYRTSHHFKNASSVTNHAQTFFAAMEAFREEIPEVESATHFMGTNGDIRKGDQLFQDDNMIATTPEFFDLFGIKLIEGNAEDLADPTVIMLSQSMAEKYFGSDQAMGESLEVEGVFGQNWIARVAGIFEDMPPNTHIGADMMIPREKLIDFIESNNIFGPNISLNQVKWRWLNFFTYLKLYEGTDPDVVTEKANVITENYRREINSQLNQEHSVWLQPLGSIHTTSGIQTEPTPTVDIKVIQLFNLIAVIILVIAWINYINIATARSVTRAKEVGIRKILGSLKSHLKIQFLLEAFILNMSALIIAFFLLYPLYPTIEELVEVQFFTGIGHDWVLISYMILMVVVGSVLSGLYPAFVLSNYQPIQVLKGKLKYSAKGVQLRRILVVIQLVFSLFLISALMIVQGQMDFMINHNLGINMDKTILLDSPTNELSSDNYLSRMETIHTELNNITGIENVTISSMVPGIESFWRGSTESRNGEEAGIFLHRANIDEDYLDLYGLELIAGRNFDPSFGSDGTAMIVNELTTKNLGYSSPEEALNGEIHFTGSQTFKIIGVVNNFYQRGVQFAFEPRTFQLDTGRFGNFISLKFNTNELDRINREVEEVYKSLFPDSPYNARFLDDVFREQYDAEKRFRNLFTSFTTVALVVACLGLIGLASYLLNQKTKEVSIRKVMGAKNSTLFVALNKEYLVISVVALFLTVPLIIYLMQQWLDNYENRIAMQPHMFIFPFVIILGIILVITFRFTLKVINSNPAVVLREDG